MSVVSVTQNPFPPGGSVALSNARFLSTVFGYLRQCTLDGNPGAPWVCGFPGDPKNAQGAWTGGPLMSAKTIPPEVNPNNNTFYNVSALRRDAGGEMHRRADNFHSCPIIPLDDVGDGPTAKVPFERIRLAPSVIIETSYGNYQLGYLLEEPETDAGKVEALIDALTGQGQAGDTAAKGVMRYMRLPEGVNGKPQYLDQAGQPFRVTARLFEPERRYTLGGIAEAFEVTPQISKRKSRSKKQKVLKPVAVDAGDDPILQILSDHGLLLNRGKRSGWYDMRCPRWEQHENRNPGDAGWHSDEGFKCFHEHESMDGYDTLKFRQDMVERATGTEFETLPEGVDAAGAWKTRDLLHQAARDRDAVEAVEWPKYEVPPPVTIEPLDIFTDFQREPPAWNPEHYPAAIAAYAQDIGRRMSNDPALACWSMLGICSGLASDRFRLQVKCHDTKWREPARIWVGVVDDPGRGKTPATAEPKVLTDALQKGYTQAHAEAMKGYEVQYGIYRKRLDRYMRAQAGDDAAPDAEKPSEPPRPKKRQVFTTEATMEGISRALEDNPQGILCWYDELGGFFGGMDAYRGNNVSKDRADWLKGFGGGVHVIDRAKWSRHLDNFSLSLFGNIQPKIIREVAKNLRDDGLLQRFIIVCAAKDRPPDYDEAPDAFAAMLWANVHDHLAAERYSGGSDQVLVMDPEAQQVMAALRGELRQLSELPHFDPRLRTALDKFPGIAGRLATLFHLIEAPRTGNAFAPVGLTVPRETVERVSRLLREYLVPHLVHFYHVVLGVQDDAELAGWAAGHILAHGLVQVTRRDFIRNSAAGLRGLDSARMNVLIHEAMGLLETAGWVEASKWDNSRRAQTWDVNPLVHERFEVKAQEEKKRRADIVVSIREKVRESV